MKRPRTVLITLGLLLVCGLLTSCSNDPTTPAPAEKRVFLMDPDNPDDPILPPPPPPPVELTFQQRVLQAYCDIPLETVEVVVNLRGDTVSVQPPDWPNSPPFTLIVPLNMIYGPDDQATIWIEYPSGDFDPLAAPVIPGDVTLFRFFGLPSLIEVEFHLPPAPWFDPLILGTSSCFYRIFEQADGSVLSGEPQFFTSSEPQPTGDFEIFHGVYTQPDNPGYGLLDPGPPGEDPEDEEDD